MGNTLKRQAEEDRGMLALLRTAWLQGYQTGVSAGIQVGERAYETAEDEWKDSEANQTIEDCVQHL
jgi:hypothetical protein